MIKIYFLILGFGLLKYFLLFVLPFFIFWVIKPSTLNNMKIQSEERQKPQILLETQYSLLTLVIQSLFFLSFYWLNEQSVFHIYSGFGSRGYWVEILAFVVYFLVYDTYFYFSHRLLHVGWLYRKIHVIHHKSLNPTPLASYSFHPVEAFINLLYFYPVLYFFPMSFATFIVLLILTDVGNLGGHLGYDFLPKQMWTSRWGSWLTTPTHHNMHHQYSKCNYGLYWRGWDELLSTLHPRTKAEFYRVKDQVI